MLIGAHVSIKGGVQNAPISAALIECECFQMFTRSPQGGAAAILTSSLIDEFLRNCKENGQKEWVVHTPYYINLASPIEKIRKNSVRIIKEELERASLLQSRYVMAHIGSSRGLPHSQGVAYAIEGIKKILADYKGSAEFLIEIAAGAGDTVGAKFEEIAEIISKTGFPVGVCFDTQHAFASGYNLIDADGLDAVFDLFERIIGLDKLKMFHCNDSKVERGSEKDRHEHIGNGYIGRNGFIALIKRFFNDELNLYLETEPNGVEEDIKTLKKMRAKI